MEFCEKCGGMILVDKNNVVCASCGHKPKKKPKIEVEEKIEKKEIVTVVKEESDNTLPVVDDMPCPKCQNKKAYFWTTQTRSSDESETKFYKCTKCKHAWRKYR